MNDQKKLINTNIESSYLLPTPVEIQRQLPLTKTAQKTVSEGRGIIRNILDGKERRLFVVVGPCSIHDPKAALEYAGKLKKLSDEVSKNIFLVMRVYFEKPRTTVGWKGLINDPFMNDSFHIEEGLKRGRKLLLQLNEIGLPVASEALDPVVPQYLSDLIAWSAIGARTIESQTHREMASGLSMPIGFKNGTDGNIEVAVNAMKSSLAPHHFLGVDSEGRPAVFKTRGNSYSHIVLRGGKRPNFDPESIAACEKILEKERLRKKIMVDCSHGNSNKDHRNQPAVFENCLGQFKKDGSSIIGMMLESNLFEGNQPIPPDLKDISGLRYGVSVTDKCIDWEMTEKLIQNAYAEL
ncbi:MAG: 3-deoxy-7-phosphoheptulonate synthase [Deltaproteobacteria bacterium]|nr:3-deoxy-7-phosphoheptulonate synthase [Deltaproteobacteria bacterium]